MIDFTVETEIARPAREVFAYVTDPTKLATWQANTVSVVAEGDGPLGLGTRLREVHRAPGGKQLASLVEVSEYEPDRVFALRMLEGALHPQAPVRRLLRHAQAGARRRPELARAGPERATAERAGSITACPSKSPSRSWSSSHRLRQPVGVGTQRWYSRRYGRQNWPSDRGPTPAQLQAFHRKRMKGFEPSTFAMARRRSSQLSYIRATRPFYPATGLRART
jgi:uncharacterized protein YndB with AHSA1/START domain